jgi:hypothetical protein
MWGCLEKIAIPDPKKFKIWHVIVNCVFIGYAYNSSAYQFLIYKLSIENTHSNTIMESKSAIFFENVFPFEELQENYSLKRII